MTRKGLVVMTILLLAMTGKQVAKLCREAERVPTLADETPWDICPYAFAFDWYLSEEKVKELLLGVNLFVTDVPSSTSRDRESASDSLHRHVR